MCFSGSGTLLPAGGSKHILRNYSVRDATEEQQLIYLFTAHCGLRGVIASGCLIKKTKDDNYSGFRPLNLVLFSLTAIRPGTSQPVQCEGWMDNENYFIERQLQSTNTLNGKNVSEFQKAVI